MGFIRTHRWTTSRRTLVTRVGMASCLTTFSTSPADVENQSLHTATGRSMRTLISIPSNFVTLLKYCLSLWGHAAQPRRLPGQGKLVRCSKKGDSCVTSSCVPQMLDWVSYPHCLLPRRLTIFSFGCSWPPASCEIFGLFFFLRQEHLFTDIFTILLWKELPLPMIPNCLLLNLHFLSPPSCWFISWKGGPEMITRVKRACFLLGFSSSFGSHSFCKIVVASRANWVAILGFIDDVDVSTIARTRRLGSEEEEGLYLELEGSLLPGCGVLWNVIAWVAKNILFLGIFKEN